MPVHVTAPVFGCRDLDTLEAKGTMLLVAVPPPGGWPVGAAVTWSAETFRSGPADAPPSVASVSETRDLSAAVRFDGLSSQSLDLDIPEKTFLVGVRIKFERVGSPTTLVTQTGGKLTVVVQRRYDSAGGGPLVASGALRVVAGPNAQATPGEVYADLTNDESAVAPGRGSRQYWPDDTRASNRKIRVIVTAGPLERDGLPDQLFSISDSGGSYRLRALALLSK